MKSDSLKFWEAERDRVSAGIRHQRIGTQDGAAMLAEIDARIAEHAHGIVSEIEAEELPTEVAPPAVATTNVTELQPVRAQRNAAVLKQQTAIRGRALAKYRKDMKRKTGRDPFDTHAHAVAMAMRSGMPMMCSPLWMLDHTAEQP